MKIKNAVWVGIILIGAGLIFFSYLPTGGNRAEELVVTKNGEQNPLPQKPEAVSQISENPKIPEKKIKIIDSEKINKNISVSLSVRQATSAFEVPDGSSVFDAMNILASQENSNFTFHSTYYSGMGYFIDEINGEKNRDNAFWVYYVNGAEASIGASNYILKNGDTIRWRLEDSAKKEVPVQ